MRRILVLLLVIGLVFGMTSMGLAEDYPSDPIQFTVPWSPGGGSDTLMRIVANHAEEYIDVPIVVQNKPGVSGTTGLKELTKARANGYNIGQIHDGLVVAHQVGITDINYDDFEFVAGMTNSPQYLAVRNDAPYDNLEEFIDYAKNGEEEIQFGVTMRGIPEAWVAMLAQELDVEFDYVSYEGTGERVEALAGGRVDAIPVDYASGSQYVEAEKFKFIAAATEKRTDDVPDVPTFKEKDVDVTWDLIRSIAAPEGTPEERIEFLEEVFEKTANNEDFQKRVEEAGAKVRFMGAEEVTSYYEEVNEAIENLDLQ